MEERRYLEEDFTDFVQQLIDNKNLGDSTEEGIAKLVVDKGYATLSPKQQYVFKNSLKHFVYEECNRCGLQIPWSEMSAAEDNGGLCGWCQQLSRNDKD